MNIISFSLWGNLPIYNIGAIENAKLRPYIYPNFVCRYYVDKSVPQSTIDELKKLGSEIVMMGEGEGFKRLFWRMYPAEDRTIGRFIVRDCDSRINIREALAVKEWMESGVSFHIMRDNRNHTLFIQGGMWGGIGGSIPNLRTAIDDFIKGVTTGYRDYYNLDQMFLNMRVWPKIKDMHMAHSIIKITGDEKPFSIELGDGMFIGQVIDENNVPLSDTRRNPLI